MITYLLSAILLGLSAGFSPGPLLTLVITETLKHNIREGIKVAIAPLITDALIVLATLFLFSKLQNLEMVLGLISLVGAVFIGNIAVESLRTKGVQFDLRKAKPQSLKKGIIVNLLSPHPYLFWISVGSPLIIQAYEISLATAVAFVLLFYFFLVGAKIFLAIVVGKSRRFLSGKIYVNVMRVLGVFLVLFAIKLAWDGLNLLGVIHWKN